MHHLRHVKPHPRTGPFLAVAIIILIAGFGLLWFKGGLQGLVAFEEGNQPPTWSGLVEVAVSPFGTTQVDLRNHARDPEGQRLVFTATAPEGLDVAVDQGVLVLTASPGFESGTFALFISDGVHVLRRVLQARVDRERYALRDSMGALFGHVVADDPFFEVAAALVERRSDAVAIELGLVSSSAVEDVVEVAAASEFPFRLSSRELRTGGSVRLEVPLVQGIIPRVELGIGRERLAIGELIPAAASQPPTGATAIQDLDGIRREVQDIKDSLNGLLADGPGEELAARIRTAIGDADSLLEAIREESISIADAARRRDAVRQAAEPLLTGRATVLGPRARIAREIAYTALALVIAVAIAVTAFLRARRPSRRPPAGKPGLPESLDEEPEPPAEAAEPAAEGKEEERKEAPGEAEEAKPEPAVPPEPPKPAMPPPEPAAPAPPPAPGPRQDEDESLEGKVLK
jgi:hypothetical protein